MIRHMFGLNGLIRSLGKIYIYAGKSVILSTFVERPALQLLSFYSAPLHIERFAPSYNEKRSRKKSAMPSSLLCPITALADFLISAFAFSGA